MTTKTISAKRTRAKANARLHDEFIQDTYPVVREFEFHSIPAESDYFAVIIEPRPHPHLEYVLRNVMHFLGSGWGLLIVAGSGSREHLASILDGWSTVWVRFLEKENLAREEFRALRKSAGYWQELKGKKLLCFEVDTLLCRPGIDEFTSFDYIGAPWSEAIAVSDVVRVGNGGLSLRSRQAMIDICRRGKARTIPSEDAFFSLHLHLHKDEYKLPGVREAMQFSVESLFYPQPLGFHKPWAYLSRSELITLYDSIQYDHEAVSSQTARTRPEP